MNFADRNAELLAALSAGFLICNGILNATPELVHALSTNVYINVSRWYEERGRTFNPDAELVEEEAVRYAFARAQMIADLAKAVSKASAE